jgi:rRNA maturation endonuclease Nob1
MRLVRRLTDVVNSLRSTDPYHYECTVCGRVFQAEESSCPECGSEVERVSGAFDSTAVDPSP